MLARARVGLKNFRGCGIVQSAHSVADLGWLDVDAAPPCYAAITLIDGPAPVRVAHEAITHLGVPDALV